LASVVLIGHAEAQQQPAETARSKVAVKRAADDPQAKDG
jgi:hypothetical protein